MSSYTSFCFVGSHPDENPGSEEMTKERDKGGNESQANDEDVALAKNDKDDNKSDGGDKDEGEDKGRGIGSVCSRSTV